MFLLLSVSVTTKPLLVHFETTDDLLDGHVFEVTMDVNFMGKSSTAPSFMRIASK